MKLLNLYREILKEEEEDEYYDPLDDIHVISIEGTFYHGTSIDPDDEIFSSPQIGYSDWEAVWITEYEHVAQEFANWHGYTDNDIQVVYQINISSDNIVQISTPMMDELKEFYGVDDPRELIPFLSQKFDGWQVVGSIDSTRYNDYAIFDDDLLEVTGVKFRTNEEEEYTEYMDVYDAYELLGK